jgi:hypothetical protein
MAMGADRSVDIGSALFGNLLRPLRRIGIHGGCVQQSLGYCNEKAAPMNRETGAATFPLGMTSLREVGGGYLTGVWE